MSRTLPAPCPLPRRQAWKFYMMVLHTSGSRVIEVCHSQAIPWQISENVCRRAHRGMLAKAEVHSHTMCQHCVDARSCTLSPHAHYARVDIQWLKLRHAFSAWGDCSAVYTWAVRNYWGVRYPSLYAQIPAMTGTKIVIAPEAENRMSEYYDA